MNNMNSDEVIKNLLEHHRFYVNRNWQFFMAILVIDSIMVNSLDKLLAQGSIVGSLSISYIVVVGVCYHLINWTNMRIDNNMKKINQYESYYTIEPKSFFEGMINWMKIGVIALSIPFFHFSYMLSIGYFILSSFLFLVLVVSSEVVVRANKQ